VTLGSDTEPGGVGRTYVLSHDSRGRFYTSHAYTRSQIQVHDSTGQFLRYIGRPGEGPGEYRRVMAITVGDDDTLFVLDPRLNRLTTLSPVTYDVVTTKTLAPGNVIAGSVIRLQHDQLVVNSMFQTRESIGYPLHAFDGSGKFQRSFGADNPIFDPRTIPRRAITPASDSTVWSALTNRYALELWSPADGMKHLEVVRDAEWFPPYDTRPPLSRDNPPHPEVIDVAMDHRGWLWTIIRVADRRWRRGLEPGPEGGFVAEREEDVYDTIIEIIDLARRRIVASGRFPQALRPFVEPEHDYAFSYRTENDIPRIDVWRVRLSIPAGDSIN
jgi:hypothetical protein